MAEGETPSSPATDGEDSNDSTHPPPQHIGANGTTTTTAAPPPASVGQMVASLRANFEKDSTFDSLKRKLPSNNNNNDQAQTSTTRDQTPNSLSNLQEALTQERELRTAYEERVTALEEELDELNTRLEAKSSDAERRLNSAQNEAKSHRRENSTLQQQLADLKRSISTSLRAGAQSSSTTDSSLEQEFGLLQHEVQNWVVNHFRKARMEDVSGVMLCERLEGMTGGGIERLDVLKRIYERFVPARKLAAFQATVACHLMEIFQERFLFGMPDGQEWKQRLCATAESLPAILPSEAYHRWRAATFDAIRQSEAMKDSAENAIDKLAGKVCLLLCALTEIDDDEGKAQASLKAILRRAVHLAHVVSVQQAIYQFLLPAPNDAFDGGSMESIFVEEESDPMDKSAILCALFPAMAKLPDCQNGENPLSGKILVKAKVLCEDDDP